MKWFIDNHVQTKPSKKLKVLDVGSYDVNGTYKHLFNKRYFKYEGLDISPGKNVDIVVGKPYSWSIKDNHYDIVISGQAFEHTEFFWLTIMEMTRVLKKDGLMCIIAPCGFQEHRYPVDCYRFFTDGMIAMARYVSLNILHAHTNMAPRINNVKWYSDRSSDSMLVASKRYSGPARIIDPKTYELSPADHSEYFAGMVKKS